MRLYYSYIVTLSSARLHRLSMAGLSGDMVIALPYSLLFILSMAGLSLWWHDHCPALLIALQPPYVKISGVRTREASITGEAVSRYTKAPRPLID